MAEPEAGKRYMRDDEIAAFYRQAANRKKQIVILAELNDVPVDEIRKILRRRGLLAKEKRQKAPVRGSGTPYVWTEEKEKELVQMLQAGMTNEEAAQRLDKSVLSIAAVKSRLKGKGYDIPRQKSQRKQKQA